MKKITKLLRRIAQPFFIIDLRSLVVLRVGMAMVMLWQLSDCFDNAGVFFSDSGVMPTELNRQVLDQLGLESAWTLYSIRGTTIFAMGIMLAHALAAVAFLFGFYTRLANIVCLVLLWSLQMRNPLITTGGDVMLRCMLAWTIFLPMGSMASWDARYRRKSPDSTLHVLSWSSMGLMLQVVVVYFFAGLAKLNIEWLSGEAMHMALQLEMYVKPFGRWLGQYPGILRVATWGTLVLELGCPLLVFAPRHTAFCRGMAMALFWLLHLGIWLTMSIGMFSIVGMLAWVIFIPPATWERIRLIRSFSRSRRRSRGSRFEQSKFARTASKVMLAFMLAINVMNTKPEFFRPMGYRSLYALGCGLMFVQEFKMFGTPPTWNPSFEYQARTEFDLPAKLLSANRNYVAKSGNKIYDDMQTQFWRRYYWNLMDLDEPENASLHSVFDLLKARLLEYQIEQWNARHPDKIASASLTCHRQRILGPENGLDSKESLIWAVYPDQTKQVTPRQ